MWGMPLVPFESEEDMDSQDHVGGVAVGEDRFSYVDLCRCFFACYLFGLADVRRRSFEEFLEVLEEGNIAAAVTLLRGR